MVAATTRSVPEECIRLEDKEAGLDGFIVIHSTARGPAAGGCRFWSYDTPEAAMVDAMRLAEGMSYKNASAELPLGGGKAVLRRPAGEFDRRRLFEAFGRAVARLDGRYVTAEDVGTGLEDMENIAHATRHVAGRTARPGFAGGDPSPWTALGVFEAMKAAAAIRFGGSLAGARVAVQGVGNVGGRLARLLADEGARLVLADIDTQRAQALASELGAEVASIADIAGVTADVFAPCALGGALDEAVLGVLKAALVCGAANNQLATPEIAEVLRARDILYAPDYVVNAGGIINVAAEYLGESEADVRGRVVAIGPRTAGILEMARAEGLTSAFVADREAEAKMRPLCVA
ncbi:amino acid dehydrogenase [Novosphingobium sp. 1949]|uniref:Amino acid dehydrogenase n=1 Tax=Novosphingobium organovorum TaxID=2930092 RepID=A0ABT0BD96_9SPHN|nr:Glu/Leu/Phe/Val dehydrogenase dimerization domain-containing protein [Novosphingobium organovorum]MCJ2182774.1 amino acid dehydrogenase [Novosphingobium organovorum]